ncbi:MAG: hypothetical protein AAF399_18520 [Bacteroidota bacterium]
MFPKYAATIFGTVITIFCFATIWVFIPAFPIFAIGLPLESMFGKVFEGSPYGVIAASVMLTLLGVFLPFTIWFFKRIRKKQQRLDYLELLLFFSLQFLLVHPLVFYIWATMNAHQAGDGQFMLGMIETIPISSSAFIGFGLWIDAIKNRRTSPTDGTDQA